MVGELTLVVLSTAVHHVVQRSSVASRIFQGEPATVIRECRRSKRAAQAAHYAERTGPRHPQPEWQRHQRTIMSREEVDAAIARHSDSVSPAALAALTKKRRSSVSSPLS
jgi:hypothetical protein